MAETKVTQTIQFKRGTAAALTNWTAVPAVGEPIYDITNKKIKIGDGSHTWSNLSYIGDEGGSTSTTKLVYNSFLEFPNVGNADSIYVLANGSTYRWDATKQCYKVLFVNNAQLYSIITDEGGNFVRAERQIDAGGANADYIIANFNYSK